MTDRRRIHLLLAVNSLLIVAVSVNRLSSLTLAFVAPNQFLRWTDLLNLVLGFGAVLVTYLLLRAVHSGRNRWLGLAFVCGSYLYAVGYGDHEVTNYLHGRFCPDTTSDLCRIIAFNDDHFSHLLFFGGFLALAAVVMAAQAIYPDPRSPSALDTLSAVVNGVFVAAGVVVAAEQPDADGQLPLTFDVTEAKRHVVGVTAALAVILLTRNPQQILLRYYAVAFVPGLIAAVLVKLVNGS